MAYSARPVPQNILSVQFKVFDLFTVKQLIITFGVVLFCLLLFYVLPAPWKVLIPAVIIFCAAIVMFVPFNGEPFLVFVSNFLEAMISPQRRIWNRKGMVVQTAYKAAKQYQFGNDPKLTDNDFKYGEAQSITLGATQKDIDKAEEQFLNNQTINTMPTQQNSNSYSPPVRKDPSNLSGNGSVSNPIPAPTFTTQQSVDLNQFQPVVAPSQTQPVQTTPEVSPQINVNPVMEVQATPVQAPISNEPSTQFLKKESDLTSPVISEPIVPQVQPVPTPVQVATEITPVTPTVVTPEPVISPTIQPQAQETPPTSTISESTTPKKNSYEIETLNYIFGNVEDYEGKGIYGAPVSIRQNEKELEFVYTNENGDFQSFKEYPAGNYQIVAYVDSKEYNSLNITHDPIDPIPVNILPSDFEERKAQKANEEELLSSTVGDDGIFTGAYDAKSFSLGKAYDETPSYSIENNSQSDTQTQFVPNTFEDKLISQAAEAEMPQEEVASPNLNTTDITPQETVLPNEIVNPSYTQTDATIDFRILPEMHESYDNSYTTLPNTVNGIALDANQIPVQGVLINILDGENTPVRTIASDVQGRFYSFAPLPSGKYTITMTKPGIIYSKYSVDLRGDLLRPKIVQSIIL